MNRIVNTSLKSKSLLAAFSVLALAVIFGSVSQVLNTQFVPYAQAQTGGCNLATVAGTYATTTQGTLPAGPFAGVFWSTLDGAGNFAGFGTVSVNGTIVNLTVTGTETVNPDCTFSSTLTDNFGNVSHGFGVITGKGKEFVGISTEPGATVINSGKRL